MKDDIQKLGAEIVSQARLPGQGVAGYASSVAGSAAQGIARPTSFADEDGLPVRYFIPGRSPLYEAGAVDGYILGDNLHA